MEGGARAWACDQVREPVKSGAASRQATRVDWGAGGAKMAWGVSRAAADCAAKQAEQEPSWARWSLS